MAVRACGLPVRAEIGGRKPRAPSGRPRLAAASRNAGRHDVAEGCVCELSSLPPDTLFFGASVSHEVKCCALGHRRMSVPISAINFNAV